MIPILGDILEHLAAMDGEAIDRERLLEEAVRAGDDTAFATALNEWMEVELRRVMTDDE